MSTQLPTRLPDIDDERGTHPAHVGHLVMGLAFLGLVGIWAVVQSGAVDTADVRWLLPLPWVVAGAAGLLAAVFSGRRSRRPAATPSAASYDEPEADDAPDDDTPATDEEDDR